MDRVLGVTDREKKWGASYKAGFEDGRDNKRRRVSISPRTAYNAGYDDGVKLRKIHEENKALERWVAKNKKKKK